MTKKYRLSGEGLPGPCGHYFPRVKISKVYKITTEVPEGDCYFVVYDCKRCGRYERPLETEELDELAIGLREMIDKKGEVDYPDLVDSGHGRKQSGK